MTIRADKSNYITVDEFKVMSQRLSQRKAGRSECKPKVTESTILRQIRDFLRLNGWKVVRIHQSLGSERGIPDLVAIRSGQTVWIEVKTPHGRLSAHQQAWLQDLEDHGGWWIVARSVEDVEHLGPREKGGK
jgi:hypothetical protein